MSWTQLATDAAKKHRIDIYVVMSQVDRTIERQVITVKGIDFLVACFGGCCPFISIGI